MSASRARIARSTAVAAALSLAVLHFAACKKNATEAPKPASPSTVAAAPSGPAAATGATAFAVTGPVADAVRNAASACNPDERLAFVSACAEYKALPAAVGAAAKAGPAPVLATLGALATDPEEKVRRIVGYLAGESVVARLPGDVARTRGTLAPAAASGLIAALDRAKGAFAIRLAGLAADAAGLTGQHGALKAVLARHPDAGVAPATLRLVMRQGRLAALPMIEDALKPAQKPEWRQAASAAPMNMAAWTEAEKAKLCPLGRAMIADADLEIAGNGAHVLARCKGPFVADMLAEGRKRADAGQWKKPFLWAYRDICFTGFFGNEKVPDDAECQKVYDFLEGVAKNEKVGAWERGFALDMIFYQRRNQKTYELLEKWRKHKVPEIAKAARDAMASLEKNYLKKK